VGFRGDLLRVEKYKKGKRWDFVVKRGIMWDN